MARLTLAKLRELKERLRKISIKPYKGYFGLSPKGLFEIKSEEELKRLAKSSPFDVNDIGVFPRLFYKGADYG